MLKGSQGSGEGSVCRFRNFKSIYSCRLMIGMVGVRNQFTRSLFHYLAPSLMPTSLEHIGSLRDLGHALEYIFSAFKHLRIHLQAISYISICDKDYTPVSLKSGMSIIEGSYISIFYP